MSSERQRAGSILQVQQGGSFSILPLRALLITVKCSNVYWISGFIYLPDISNNPIFEFRNYNYLILADLHSIFRVTIFFFASYKFCSLWITRLCEHSMYRMTDIPFIWSFTRFDSVESNFLRLPCHISCSEGLLRDYGTRLQTPPPKRSEHLHENKQDAHVIDAFWAILGISSGEKNSSSNKLPESIQA